MPVFHSADLILKGGLVLAMLPIEMRLGKTPKRLRIICYQLFDQQLYSLIKIQFRLFHTGILEIFVTRIFLFSRNPNIPVRKAKYKKETERLIMVETIKMGYIYIYLNNDL